MNPTIQARKIFGGFIRKSRAAANVTQRDVAEALGYSTPQFISNVERGRCMFPISDVATWCALLKVSRKTMIDQMLAVEAATLRGALRRK